MDERKKTDLLNSKAEAEQNAQESAPIVDDTPQEVQPSNTETSDEQSALAENVQVEQAVEQPIE